MNVTDEVIQQNPEFSRLLNSLSQHINSDGTSVQAQKDLQQVSVPNLILEYPELELEFRINLSVYINYQTRNMTKKLPQIECYYS